MNTRKIDAKPGLDAKFRRNGGARRDRTDDLLNANQALSQLSYGPIPAACISQIALPRDISFNKKEMVGLGRLERPTSPLSGVRSNHLSYRPVNQPHDR